MASRPEAPEAPVYAAIVLTRERVWFILKVGFKDFQGKCGQQGLGAGA